MSSARPSRSRNRSWKARGQWVFDSSPIRSPRPAGPAAPARRRDRGACAASTSRGDASLPPRAPPRRRRGGARSTRWRAARSASSNGSRRGSGPTRPARPPPVVRTPRPRDRAQVARRQPPHAPPSLCRHTPTASRPNRRSPPRRSMAVGLLSLIQPATQPRGVGVDAVEGLQLHDLLPGDPVVVRVEGRLEGAAMSSPARHARSATSAQRCRVSAASSRMDIGSGTSP